MDDEAKCRAVDEHIDEALCEGFVGRRWLSRRDFAETVQRRLTQAIGPGFPVRDGIDEILGTFMFRDDSA